MTSLAVVLAIAVAALSLSACHESANVERCDRLLATQEETIGQMGGWLRCDPSYDADEQSNCPPTFRCQSVMEWDVFNAGRRVPVAWLWQANLDDYWLRINAFELVYETYQYAAGHIPNYFLNVQRDSVPLAMQQAALSWAVGQAA